MSARRQASSTQPAPPPTPLSCALAGALADALAQGEDGASDEASRHALEHALGRALTPTQARMLATREAERGDLRAIASRLPAPTPPASSAASGLSREDLVALPTPLWQETVEWLLGTEGHRLERLATGAGGAATQDASAAERLCWHSAQAGAERIIVATRLSSDSLLDQAEIEACQALARAMGPQQADGVALPLVIISPARATIGAVRVARALGARLDAAPDLQTMLDRLAATPAEEQTRATENLRERATAASAARQQLLATLADLATAAERATRGSGRRKAASTRAAVAEAVATVSEPLRTLARMNVAWETLIEEWQGGFGTTAARTGTLDILVDAEAFATLAERAGHLRTIGLPALQRIAASAPAGELGYGSWRAALCEAITARLRAWRAQVSIVDPAAWQDFPAARSTSREVEASRATSEYTHAASRLQKARADLANHAALDVPDL